MWYMSQLEYHSAIKKKEILTFVTTWIDFEGTMLNEISLRRQILYSLTHMWNLKKINTWKQTKVWQLPETRDGDLRK